MPTERGGREGEREEEKERERERYQEEVLRWNKVVLCS